MSALFSFSNFADTRFGAAVGVGDDGDAPPGILGSGINLLNMQRNRKWVGPTAPIDSTTNAIEITFSGIKTGIDIFAVLDTDFDFVATTDVLFEYQDVSDVWQSIASGSELGSAGAIDTFAPHIVKVFTTPISAKGIRLVWKDNSSLNLTVSASRFWAGRAIYVGDFFSDYREEIVSGDVSVITAGRNMNADLCDRVNKKGTIILDHPSQELIWGAAGISESLIIARMLEAAGKSRDIIFLPAYATAKERRRTIVYGTIVNDVRVAGLRPKQVSIQLLEL